MISDTFAFLARLQAEVMIAAEGVVNKYSDDLQSELPAELAQFAKFIKSRPVVHGSYRVGQAGKCDHTA